MKILLAALSMILLSAPASADRSFDLEAKAWLDSLEGELETLDREFALQEWGYYTRGEAGEMASYRERIAAIYRDPALFDRLRLYREEVENPETARRADILFRLSLAQQVDGVREIYTLQDSLSNIQINHRAELYGEPVSDNDLVKALRFERDRSRREGAWRARYGVGDRKAQGLADLVHLRNREARRLGYRDFYAYRLDVIGVDEEELLALLFRLRDFSEGPYHEFAARLREGLGVPSLEPWDLRFAYEPIREEIDRYYPKEKMEETVIATFRALGLPVDELPILVDGEPRPGKSQHAYSFPVDAPDDVRILYNADSGIASTRTLLHEMGHSVHSALVDEPYFSFQSPPSKGVSEGVAEFFGALADEPEWQAAYLGIPEETIARYREFRRLDAARELRRMLLYILLEREMYMHPERNVTEAYWDLANDLLTVGRHPEIAAWAQLIHYTTHPVYYQNYLLGDLITAQFRHHLRKSGGGIIDRESTGTFFRDQVFRHGARRPWNELMASATGEPLNPEHYVNEWLANGEHP